MKKKLLCLLLSAMMVLSLAACGGNEASAPAGNGSGTAATSAVKADADKNETPAPTEVDTSGDIATPKGEFPIVTEPVTVTLGAVNNGMVEDFETNYYTKWLEEKTGIDLAFEEIPSADLVQKVSLAFASDTLPDAFVGVGRADASVFSVTNLLKYGVNGSEQIVPLNTYIDKYGDEIVKLFEKYEQDDFEKLMTSADGNIYFMSMYGPSIINRSSGKIWINKGWLEKLGLEVPTTTEEFEAVLEAFATQDPNGNGKADEIPLVGTANTPIFSGYDALIASFITNNTQYHRLLKDGSGVKYAPTTDEWREAMKYINELTSKGLLSQLTFTQDDTALKQIINDENDICGAFTSLGIGFLGVQDPDILARYEGIAPLAGPSGYQTGMLNVPTPSAGGVITSKAEHPDVIFRLFDLMVGFEASTISRYGEEGVNWEQPPEGAESFYGTPATIKILENCFSVNGNQMWQNLCPFTNDIHNDGQMWDGTITGEYKNAQTAKIYLNYEPTDHIATLILNEEEADVANEIMINLDNYVKETIAKFAVGEYDPNSDADWDKYLKEFNNLELNTFLDIAATAYARMEE